MVEQSTEITLGGMIGLLLGVIVVIIFFGIALKDNVLTGISDMNQKEQLITLYDAAAKVCTTKHTVSKTYVTVFEDYQIVYKDSVDDMENKGAFERLGCYKKCLCVYRGKHPLECKSLVNLENLDCQAADMKKVTRLGFKTDLKMPENPILQEPMTCKYELTLSWVNGDIEVSGRTQAITRMGSGKIMSWVPWGSGHC